MLHSCATLTISEILVTNCRQLDKQLKEIFFLLISNLRITLKNKFSEQVFVHTVWQGADRLVSCGSASAGRDVLCLMSGITSEHVLGLDFMFLLWLEVVSHTVLLHWWAVTFSSAFPHTQGILGFSSESMSVCLCSSSLTEELCPQSGRPPDSSEHFSTK